MRRAIINHLMVTLLVCTVTLDAYAQNRIALLIGNANYQMDPLRNPHRDVRLLESSLRQAGFQTQSLYDASHQQMGNAVRSFTQRSQYADAAFFYFSGHGLQHNGENYLIPIRHHGGLLVDTQLRYQTQALGEILDGVKARNFNMIVVDACRTAIQRSTRNSPTGLAMPNTGNKGDVIIAFSTAPGTPAFDGISDSSPYAAELARHMLIPGLKVEDVLKKTTRGVLRRTNERQRPWQNNSLTGDFYFMGSSASSPAPRPTAQPARPSAPQPSWCNNGKKKKANEHLVCDRPELWALEAANVKAYREARSRNPAGGNFGLRRWVRERYACGSDFYCTKASFERRIRYLKSQ